MKTSSFACAGHHNKRHRFPAEIIARAVWLYYRFPLSLRHVEDLLAERGIDVSFQKAALKLIRKLLKGQGVTPRVMVTDKPPVP
jgi:transposase-like protein